MNSSAETDKRRRSFWSSRRISVFLGGLFLLAIILLVSAVNWKPSHEVSSPTDDKTELVRKIHQPETPRELPDPKRDGWSSEVLSNEVNSQLKRLEKFLTEPSNRRAGLIQGLTSDDFSCGNLLPQSLEIVYQKKYIQVERTTLENELTALPNAESFRGRPDLAKALVRLLDSVQGAKSMHAKFKLVHLEQAESEHFSTRVLFSLSGRTFQGMFEQNATWTIGWKRLSAESLPRIRQIRVDDFEQVTTKTSGPLFSDCTEFVLGKNSSYKAQMQFGNSHWSRRIESHLHYYLFSHNGLAVGDINGDGLDDVYRCQAGGLPNRLYLQKRDGTAIDVSQAAGVDYLDNTRSALILDLENDGDQDLVLALFDTIIMLENDGMGKFSLRARIPGVPHGYSLAASDYNLDGFLDIYVCVYYATGKLASKFPVPVPYFNANNGGSNFLFKNNGNWQFINATEETGLSINNHRFSYAAAWEDYDNDGDADLYVANDFGLDNLFRNDNGRFTDVTAQAGLEGGAFGMSVSFGDYNRDGLMDLYVGNMYSAAGNRITTQSKFKPQASAKTKEMYQRLTRGNSLFQNIGNGKFQEIGEQAGVRMGRWAWSSLFADLNNDGWDDILVANGFLTGEDNQDL